MRPRLACLRVLVLALPAIAARAHAQEPTKLPPVIVKGARGPGVLGGTVHDKSQNPLEGVEILIPALQRLIHSDVNGAFKLTGLPSGTYDIWARKIGYYPQIEKGVKIGGAGAGVDFIMPRAPRALPPMLTSAAAGGLSGTVADTSFRGLPGATVHVQGEGLTAETIRRGLFSFRSRPANTSSRSARKDSWTGW